MQIIEPSNARRKPPCPVADRCGGCSWQHVDYSVQIQQKEKILRDSLRKIEKLQTFKWGEFIPAPDEFHYRNRVQLQVRAGKFGFFSKGTRDLVAIGRCWIAEDKINHQMAKLTPAELNTTRLEIAVRPDGETVMMSDQRDPEEALFSQVNTAQNTRLIELMLAATHVKPDWVMDLYCGSGNLTVPLARKFPGIPLTAVDLSRSSIERASRLESGARPSAQNPHPVKFHAGDVAKVLAQIPVSSGTGLIVLDPPRTGCEPEVIEQILRHRPKQILYISCNPTTFARDVERLLIHPQFRVESVQGLDMFPQTEHVELISSLCTAT